MKTVIKIFAVLLVSYGIAIAADRDPFQPYTGAAPVAAEAGMAKPGEAANPLTDKPLSSYTVIGVVISPTDALAVLRSRDKHEYFAYIGDKVGLEGGLVETIDNEGITVDVGGRIIPLKVSNRFENQDEKTDEKK